MSVVVSDTSPLHYLILCGTEDILPRLFNRVIIPPTVFKELQQANTPLPVRQWAASLPTWVAIQMPKATNLELDLDAGEREAISLAQEIHADAVLMDDRAGRNAAKRCGLAVVGTIGVLEEAAARGLITLPEIMERLRNTNVRLDPGLVRAALERNEARNKGTTNSFRGSVQGSIKPVYTWPHAFFPAYYDPKCQETPTSV